MSTGLAVDCAGLQGEATEGVNWTQTDEMLGMCKQEEVELMLIAAPWGCVCKYPPFHSEARDAQQKAALAPEGPTAMLIPCLVFLEATLPDDTASDHKSNTPITFS